VEVEPGVVAALAARLDTDPDAAAVCPLLTDEQGKPLSRFRAVPSPADLLKAWKSGNTDGSLPADLSSESAQVEFAPKQAVMVRKQFVKGMNYLDERYGEFGADAELFYQIQHAGKKVLLLPGLKAIFRPEDPKLPQDALAQLSADEALGATAYAGKHGGFFAWLGTWFGAVFHVLIKLLSFQQPGYQMSRLVSIISGQKIDGSQGSI
jgi:hypothetical protein